PKGCNRNGEWTMLHLLMIERVRRLIVGLVRSRKSVAILAQPLLLRYRFWSRLSSLISARRADTTRCGLRRWAWVNRSRYRTRLNACLKPAARAARCLKAGILPALASLLHLSAPDSAQTRRSRPEYWLQSANQIFLTEQARDAATRYSCPWAKSLSRSPAGLCMLAL